MPELAEVEFFRNQWAPGLGQQIIRVHLQATKRVFRGTDAPSIHRLMTTELRCSRSHGKQMLFEFSGGAWLGIHLGMTGALRTEPMPFVPGKHDHLVLFTRNRSLIFSDPRQFGRIRLEFGAALPKWWSSLPPAIGSPAFTLRAMTSFLGRHRQLPIKGALLLQDGFPGVGNWMGDEILWRAKLSPKRLSGDLSAEELKKLWATTRFVCRAALKHVSPAFEDPPHGWLFHSRWHRRGLCPADRTLLNRETICGRSTAWCPKCQPPFP